MATSLFVGDSGAGRGGRSEAMAEMNITPLVDVMLVLLVIFMVTAPMVTGSIDMRLPQHDGQPLSSPPRHLSLDVGADGSYTLDGAVLSERTLQSTLAQVAREAPNAVIELGANENADYQAFTRALADVRQSGLGNVALKQ
jgi:biopolymer transport protein ExbD